MTSSLSSSLFYSFPAFSPHQFGLKKYSSSVKTQALTIRRFGTFCTSGDVVKNMSAWSKGQVQQKQGIHHRVYTRVSIARAYYVALVSLFSGLCCWHHHEQIVHSLDSCLPPQILSISTLGCSARSIKLVNSGRHHFFMFTACKPISIFSIENDSSNGCFMTLAKSLFDKSISFGVKKVLQEMGLQRLKDRYIKWVVPYSYEVQVTKHTVMYAIKQEDS